MESAYMVLGLLYLDEPRFLGGDPQRQLRLWKRVCASESQTHFFTCIWLKLTLRVGRTADARRQLNAIISMSPDQSYLPGIQRGRR